MCAKLHYLKYLDYCHAKKTPYDLSIIGRLFLFSQRFHCGEEQDVAD